MSETVKPSITRFALRMDEALAAKVNELSTFSGLSMNKVICRALENEYERFTYRKQEMIELQKKKTELLAELQEINHQLQY